MRHSFAAAVSIYRVPFGTLATATVVVVVVVTAVVDVGDSIGSVSMPVAGLTVHCVLQSPYAT